MPARAPVEEILDLPEAAALLRTTPNALYCQRSRGQGPPFVRIGRKLIIRKSTLLAWIDQLAEPRSA